MQNSIISACMIKEKISRTIQNDIYETTRSPVSIKF